MPGWILAALRLLATGAGLSLGFEGAQRVIGGESGGAEGPFVQIGSGRGGGVVVDQTGRRLVHLGGHLRRRRRRALTASDRADIAFIAGMISKAAAKDFAVQLAARPR